MLHYLGTSLWSGYSSNFNDVANLYKHFYRLLKVGCTDFRQYKLLITDNVYVMLHVFFFSFLVRAAVIRKAYTYWVLFLAYLVVSE